MCRREVVWQHADGMAGQAADARGRVEPVGAALVAVLGMGLTTYGALTHTAPLLAPGSALVLGGGAWLGNLLARRNVRLFPAGTPASPPGSAEDAR